MAEVSASHQQRLTLDIVLYQEGEWWIAHCVQLDIMTSGTDANNVFQDAQDLCRAQIVYAAEFDTNFENLFRPARPDLMSKMALARREGIIDLQINAREVQVNRLLAHAA